MGHLLADRLLHSNIREYITINSESDESNEIVRIQFSSTLHQQIARGLQISWKLIANKLVNNEHGSIVSVKVDDFNGNECLHVTYNSNHKLEYINHFIVTLIQYLQETVFEYQQQQVSNNISYKKILLTGCAGWLGQFVFHHLLSTWNSHSAIGNTTHELVVYGAYNDEIPDWIIPSHRIHFDLTSKDSIRAGLNTVQPDIIIHLAAISSPAKCHQLPELAFRINCPGVFIDLVNEIVPDCHFIFTSTDMVYDGESPPYHVIQSAIQKPVNIYGESKLAFEHLVTTRLNNSTVLRLSNMIGPPYVYRFCGEKFMQFLYKSYNQSPRVYLGLKTDEIRCFVYVQDVNQIITQLIAGHFRITDCTSLLDTALSGGDCKRPRRENRVLNVGGPKGLSRLQVAEALCKAQDCVLEVHTSKAAQDPVNCNSSLADSKWTVYTLAPSPAAAAVAVSDSGRDSSSSGVGRELRSPRDISMSSADTEVYINEIIIGDSSNSTNSSSSSIGFKFTPLEECMLDCLHVHV